MPGRDLCLLSLDGGGIRGLSSLQVLKQLMETVGSKAGLESPPKPCDYFDMIGGTSTGGLLAIMLGRLKMDIDACIDAYTEMSDKIFQKKHHRVNVKNCQTQGRFDSHELERAVKHIIRNQGLDEDSLLMDRPDTTCKVFVCATSKLTSDTVHLTSYQRARGGGDRLRVTKIWEAARATSAASSFFDPIRISIGKVGEEFVDGATGANNPVQELWNEAKDMWDTEPLKNNLKCMVSIGTGVPSIEPFRTGILEIGKTLVRISTETEKTAELFQRTHSDLDDSNRYFRFNVRNGLEKIGLEDSFQKDAIMAVTRRYVESQDTFKLMKLCASNLAERENFNAALLPRDTMGIQKHFHENHQLLENISRYDHEKVHRRLSHKRLEGTGQWFLEHPKFKQWLNAKGSPSLWCSGIIGSGKTMIATAVVEVAKDNSKKFGTAALYFYCENTQRDMLKGSDLLSSFIKQLLVYLAAICKPSPAAIQQEIQKFFGKKHSEPDFDDLTYIFLSLATYTPKAIYVIDGLDEFDENEVEKVLRIIRQFFGSKTKQNSSRILIFSRDQIAPYLNVTRFVPGTVHVSTLNNTGKDMQKYIETAIEDKMCVRELTSNPDLMEETQKRLLEGASGMFLWVYLQVEALWDICFTDADIRRTLANLPKDLKETYRRCLERINYRSPYASKVLKWVGYAIRPLHIDELKEAVAFDLQDQAWSSDKIPDSTSVISYCANLVILDTTDLCVRFAHPSVKQYLESNRGEILAYPIDPKRGELDCGEFCVAYLSFSNFGLQIENTSDTRLPMKTPDLMATLNLGSFGAVASKISRFVTPTPDQQGKPIYMRISRKPTPAPNRNQYKFLDYAVANWATQTKTITRQSTVWDRFQRLAMNPNESWKFYPWKCGGRSQSSLLHGLLGWAVKEHHMPLLKIVLDLEPRYGFSDICNLPLIDGSLPALHLASRLGFEDVVKHLLEVCAVNTTDREGYMAVHHAAEKGHLEVAKLLSNAERAKVDASSNLKCTPLWLAASNGHERIVSLLIGKRAKFNVKNKEHGETPLSRAAGNGHEAVVKLLLEKGADLETKDSYFGLTPLLWAAERGHEAVVNLLLEKGAHLEAIPNDGRTPLWWAAERGHEAVVKLLLEKGADLEAKDFHTGQTLLSWAAENKHEAVVNLLFKQGAYLKAKDSRIGRTPLSWAAEHGHEAVVKLLLDKGADFEAKDFDTGQTPLSWAAGNGHEAVVKLLLEKGVDLEANAKTAVVGYRERTRRNHEAAKS